MFLIISGILVISGVLSCKQTIDETTSFFITEYHSFDGTLIDSKDSINFIKTGDSISVHFYNGHKRDTTFTVIIKDSTLCIKKNDKNILSHNFRRKKIVISNLWATFFTPYLSNNSILDDKKVYKINSKPYCIYRFLENDLNEEMSSGYSYYLDSIGFIAYTNSKSQYYSTVVKINHPSLTNVDFQYLMVRLQQDSSFFKKKKDIPPLPKEYQ